ncbi:hypothetical protein ASZ90_003100 [hydrocarbon metagenome]|uniref:Uncharacterized protein n=1 Tax=hydrocarbon metagenome TaxID=938273 RepID=A0A0W8G1T0_9ZZZZ
MSPFEPLFCALIVVEKSKEIENRTNKAKIDLFIFCSSIGYFNLFSEIGQDDFNFGLIRFF